MSVAVSCNLSDGVIVGTDSAVSVPGAGGIWKVYENAEKLFPLGERPIGLAIFGLGTIGQRTIGSYIREFEAEKRSTVAKDSTATVGDVANEIKTFFDTAYIQTVAPAVEQANGGVPFSQLPPEKIPTLGIVVAGFSPTQYLSEVWEVRVPTIVVPGALQGQPSVWCLRGRGNFGGNWFATYDPILRYFRGWDNRVMTHILAFLKKTRNVDLSPAERHQLAVELVSYEYQVPFAAMPIAEGVQHVRFLIDLVINHHRFALGAPIVGGRPRIGKVTSPDGKFEIMEGVAERRAVAR